MFKLFTAVILTITISAACAYELEQVDPNYSVKNILRSKMWYEGLSFQTTETGNNSKSDTAENRVPMPEELAVALDKLDS